MLYTIMSVILFFLGMYCTSKYFIKRDVLHPNLSHDVLASICDLHLYVCVSTCLSIS